MSFSKKRYFSFFLAFVILALFISCSRSKPEITYGFMQLVMYQEDNKPREQFSFFVIADDEEGLENLDELYLFHDKEQLRWRIKSDEWVTLTKDDKTWIGTRSIAIHDGMTLPRGVYRAVLVNKGGERGERNFTFDANVRFPFPELVIENDVYTIKSEWPVNRFICYDRSGNYASTMEINSLTGNISQLNFPSSVSSVALWAEDGEYFCSALTNAVNIR